MNGELTVAKENSPLVRRTGQQISRGFRRYAIFLILAALILFFNALEPAFLRANNLLSVLQSVAVVIVLGIGVTVTLAVDGFDLSVGSVAAFTLMSTSYAMVVLRLHALETVLLALFAGAAIGLINGLLIVGLRIPDLLATLAMMFVLAGLELIPSTGRSITVGLNLPDGSVAAGAFDSAFLAIGRDKLCDLEARLENRGRIGSMLCALSEGNAGKRHLRPSN
jgi:simple sugar transport system permease protein